MKDVNCIQVFGRSVDLSALLQLRRTLAALNVSPETDPSDDDGEAWLLSLSDTGTNLIPVSAGA